MLKPWDLWEAWDSVPKLEPMLQEAGHALMFRTSSADQMGSSN